MNILAGREHSVAELQQKLRQKLQQKLRRKLPQKTTESDDYSEPDAADETDSLDALIETVLEQLISDKLLDETRFTTAFIRSRTAKGSGPVKIRHELMERGISSELIEEYLDDSYELWQEHIEAVRSKRFGVQRPQDYKEQSKQSRFLYQRGFSGELIQRLFNDI